MVGGVGTCLAAMVDNDLVDGWKKMMIGGGNGARELAMMETLLVRVLGSLELQGKRNKRKKKQRKKKGGRSREEEIEEMKK